MVLCTFSSCEKEVEFSGKETSPKIVVNAIIGADSILEVDVSRSVFILDNKTSTKINDATVKIISDGATEVLAFISDGKYRSTQKGIRGKTYSIEVSAPNFQTVNSTCQIPSRVIITKIDTSTRIGTFGGGGIDGGQGYTTSYMNVNLKFNDLEESYYKIRVLNKAWRYNYGYDSITNEYEIIDSTYSTELMPMYLVLDQSIIDAGSGFENGQEDDGWGAIYLTNKGLNTGANGINLKLQKGYGVSNYYINMQKIDKSLYLYVNSLQQQIYSTGDPFAQPVVVYSNINEGMGIFAGYASTVDSVKNVR